jgi:hypothetical protein
MIQMLIKFISYHTEKQHFSNTTNNKPNLKHNHGRRHIFDTTIRNKPFQFVLALHHLQGRTAGIDKKCPLHSFLPFLDAPLLLPDLQRRHVYSPADNVIV